MDDKPIVSVITAVYNRADMITTAIESVRNQSIERVEHIIIDAGSRDGTLDVLARYPHLRIVSGPDDGVYDAWNKGISIARGEYVTFLNSDDRWAENSLSDLLSCLNKQPEIDGVIAGSAHYEIHFGSQWTLKHSSPPVEPKRVKSNPISGVWSINSWLIRHSVFSRIGTFDNSFPLVADKDFYFRCALANLKFVLQPIEFYQYLYHEGSLTFSSSPERYYKLLNEDRRLAWKYIPTEPISSTDKRAMIEWHIYLSRTAVKLGFRLKRYTSIITPLLQYVYCRYFLEKTQTGPES
jgi:glycosyltransferase involved in cell wall biosynthesis